MAKTMSICYTVEMRIRRTRTILLASIVGVMALALAMATRAPGTLLGRVLEGDALLRTQAESDFDRDGDVDFLDFTVFSAFYEEEA